MRFEGRCGFADQGAVGRVRARGARQLRLPGLGRTDMAKVYINKSDDPAAARAEIDAESPMGRIARPDEIAASILYLASDVAGIVTGVVLPIDGGSMASG